MVLSTKAQHAVELNLPDQDDKNIISVLYWDTTHRITTFHIIRISSTGIPYNPSTHKTAEEFT